MFLPCKAVQEEKETHWLEPEHTLSTLVITTDLPDLITDAEIALLVTQPRNTNCLHILSVTVKCDKHLPAREVSVAALQLLSASWKVFPEGELS